jgi:hypothetical protein
VLPPVAEAHPVVPPPVATLAVSSAASDLDPSRPAPLPTAPPPPPAPAFEAPPPPPPRVVFSPPPVYTGYDQLQPSEGKEGRTGLIIGIVIAIIICLAAVGVGVFYVLDRVHTSASATAAASASSTTALPQTTVTPGSDAGTASSTPGGPPATSTPPATAGGGGSTSTVADPRLPYLTATDTLVKLLTGDDARIPVLADQINTVAPNIPTSVSNELQAMKGTIDAASAALGGLGVPSGFQESNGWLNDAATYMGERIQATILGVEAIRNGDTATASAGYFAQGRTARDNFRAAFQKFQDSLPIE